MFMRQLMKQLFSAVFGVVICGGATLTAQTLEWSQSLDLGQITIGRAVSADGLGNVYLSGSFDHNSYDAFVSKYDAAGNQVWTRQLGSGTLDQSLEVFADTLGNVFSVGRTGGGGGAVGVGGTVPVGTYDAYIAKYDASGNLDWVRQWGTAYEAYSVSADGLGNAYVTGDTDSDDAYLEKYDATGNLLWTRQFGSNNDDASAGVSLDALGFAYITGLINGNLSGPNSGGHDAFVAKYDPAGSQLWLRQFGTTGTDGGLAVSADALGNVYVAGVTDRSLDGPNAGGYDVFVRKYDGSGNLLWGRQLGSFAADGCCAPGLGVFGGPNGDLGIAADNSGNIYLGGWAGGNLGGSSAGGKNAFVAKYDAVGNLHWVEQVTGAGSSVSADGTGNVYVSGSTIATGIAFVAKFRDVVPEPTSAALGVLALGCLAVRRRPARR
jgi:hypothetical protein